MSFSSIAPIRRIQNADSGLHLRIELDGILYIEPSALGLSGRSAMFRGRLCFLEAEEANIGNLRAASTTFTIASPLVRIPLDQGGAGDRKARPEWSTDRIVTKDRVCPGSQATSCTSPCNHYLEVLHDGSRPEQSGIRRGRGRTAGGDHDLAIADGCGVCSAGSDTACLEADACIVCTQNLKPIQIQSYVIDGDLNGPYIRCAHRQIP